MINTSTVFSITVLDQQGQQRNFLCQLERIEIGFDVLSTIVSLGSTLLEANLIEGGTVTPLPLDAFDGTSYVNAIENLEQEWLLALTYPPDAALLYVDIM